MQPSEPMSAASPTTSDRPLYPKLPAPSALGLSPRRFPDAPPKLAVRFGLAARRFLLRLADALLPGELVALELSLGHMVSSVLAAVTQLGVAELLEKKGPLDAAAIAAELSLDRDAVHRTLRTMANVGVFTMSDDGRFANNKVSRALVGGNLARTREWVLYCTSGSNSAAWRDYAQTLRTGESAFARVHGMNVWDWFDAHPEEREMFAHAMMGITVVEAPVIAAIYPFKEVKQLCDVGGGRGTLLSELLLRHPHLAGVLCDAPGVIESARPLLAARGVADRTTLAHANFFESVPSGSDAYLLKNILHDWDDPTCKKILSVVRAAMQPGGKVILCEMLVEPNSRELVGTRADLQMLIACENGRERGIGELHALLSATGFRPARVFHGAIISVVEGEAV